MGLSPGVPDVLVVSGRRYTARPRGWWVQMGVRVVLLRDVVHGVRFSWSGSPLGWERRHVAGLRGMELLHVVSELAMSLLRKGDSRRVQGGATTGMEADELASRFPVLWSYLTQTAWEDGQARQTSNLLIFCQDGILKGMLRDRDAGFCLWTAAGSLGALLDVMEASLLDPNTEWRVDRQAQGQQAKRVKKGS